MKRTLYIVDDDPSFRLLLNKVLSKDYQVQLFPDAKTCLKQIETEPPALVISDYAMPETNGLELTMLIKERFPEVPIIVMTAYGSVEAAVEVLKQGAFHYLEKNTAGSVSTANFNVLKELIHRAIRSVELHEETARYKTEVEKLQQEVTQLRPVELIGNSSAMKSLRAMLEQISGIDSTVLIRGETGTGKNLAASIIHKLSRRQSAGKFIEINCAALPETLLEAELFGHEQGAFTDAKSTKKGLFEIADGGTIFLDEIDSASMAVQSKLLSVLETKAFRRVGGTKPITADVRLICATNASLEEKVTAGKFREDLFYRINVISFLMPPLRELGEDVILLAERFVQRFSQEMNKPLPGLTETAKAVLRRHLWKGNVRELRNVIERAVIFAPASQLITADQITLTAIQTDTKQEIKENLFCIETGKSLEEVKLAYIKTVLTTCSKNYTEAARILGISPKSLWEIRKRHGLETSP
ncbi:two component, sigma54 specific, transcriptional regulator, Fis family [Chloroherpeton thalassium ATCC 35110]|uniref:Two component, sigma54 specific, transcriptional regulator, Fis family n=1 Tax=Chloroherpeton thalassium (strain ATCC 35110 / GB-78) TaxID=517418 RepID=B3QUF0_CHLT3|nr:sigma-54 dependent transcriptional regulator [Chloroherpeton thalassium]ACF14399.1 two component, sigma54 specific, transcriptional regulator, Fis family [Chloroherpeton thalassium ATCC 35110]